MPTRIFDFSLSSYYENSYIHCAFFFSLMDEPLEKLPDLVKAALSSACYSGKFLSWKVQESEKGTLIQLVWKPSLERQDRDSALGFNWNSRNSMQLSNQYESESNRILVSRKRKRMTPSSARRNAKRLQAFLERKSHRQLAS